MDQRLRSAVDASIGWYDDICALHGVGSILDVGVWSALETPPPLHSDAVAVEPEVTADRVIARLDGRVHCGVKDSFATMDLSGEGMDLLFSATWIHREAGQGRDRRAPSGWGAVTTAAELAVWTGQHDTSDVLLPPCCSAHTSASWPSTSTTASWPVRSPAWAAARSTCLMSMPYLGTSWIGQNCPQ